MQQNDSFFFLQIIPLFTFDLKLGTMSPEQEFRHPEVLTLTLLMHSISFEEQTRS